MDPKHPAYDAALAQKWGGALLQSYQLMDQIVGDAMTAAQKKNAALIVLSDHGFASFRKAVNYNTWLVMNGYMTLKSGVTVKARNVEMLFDQGQFWENVDWSHTKAYAMGLGEMYVNLKGRESQGVVAPGLEYDALKQELKSKLVLMQDPEDGAYPVRRVLTREEAYGQFDPNMIPDLVVMNNDGYRVSWQTSLGGVPKQLIEPNKQTRIGVAYRSSIKYTVNGSANFSTLPVPKSATYRWWPRTASPRGREPGPSVTVRLPFRRPSRPKT
jgi:predicted AlkP superfamily phosphohydrolase/phosphomutase